MAPSIRYMNQSAPFWDFVASLENQGSSHPFFGGNDNTNTNTNSGNNESGAQQDSGPRSSTGPWDWHRNVQLPFMPFMAPPPGPPPMYTHGEGPGYPPHPPPFATAAAAASAGPSTACADEKRAAGKDDDGGEKDKEMEDKTSDENSPDDPEKSPREGGPCRRRRRGHCGPGGPGHWHHGHHRTHGQGHGPFGGRGGWGPWGGRGGCGRRGGGGPGGFGFGEGQHPFWGFVQGLMNGNGGNEGMDGEGEDMKPEIDVFDLDGAYVVHVSLPGAKKEDIGVSWDAEKSELGVSGVMHRPGDEDFLKTLAMGERKVGAFERKVRLGTRASPAQVDIEGITAKLEDGILMVEVPKLNADFVEVKKVDVE